ncbi:GGDEF domain-containing protein [Butyrivibrio sp. AC2005]|uniref:GGDEF domain-containing protein n=1 Tax=Butyrivibrio sp. AC2005 TaxID=1280672 RepID=UPI000413EB4E|nr:GGDEF domain-containing protein [Butyrivibrio sp. AC2005]
MRRRILFLSAAFISFIVLLIMIHLVIKPKAISKINILNEGWDVLYNETEYKDVKLSALRGLIGNGTKKGDRIILVHKNIELSDYSSPIMMFETRFSAFKVSCNDKIIASKDFDTFEKGRFIGCDNHYINLPNVEENAFVKIEILVSEDGAYSYYEPVVIGEYTDVILYLSYNDFYIFMISAFLIIFGIMFLAIAIGFRSSISEMNMQMYSAILFIMLGIWFLSQFKLLDLFVNTYGHQTEIEYISLYLIVPIMYMVMGSMQNYLKNKVFLCFSITGSIIAVLPIAIHYLGGIHMNQMLMVYQLDAFILFLFMVIMLVKDSKNKRISPSATNQLVGQAAISVSFIFNVIFYYSEVMGISEQIMLSKVAVPIGTMCMVFATLVNYHIYISESYARKKENESLAHLAYADGLTGISNRSMYEKYLKDMTLQDKDYCIISIDLNGLKTINDGQGHLMGDKYLGEFSSILDECFSEKGFVARIGGDEFVAVLTDENITLADEIIRRINFELEKLNLKDPVYERSAAFGYAFRHEADDTDFNNIYLLADERMYKNKTDMKSKRA